MKIHKDSLTILEKPSEEIKEFVVKPRSTSLQSGVDKIEHPYWYNKSFLNWVKQLQNKALVNAHNIPPTPLKDLSVEGVSKLSEEI